MPPEDPERSDASNWAEGGRGGERHHVGRHRASAPSVSQCVVYPTFAAYMTSRRN